MVGLLRLRRRVLLGLLLTLVLVLGLVLVPAAVATLVAEESEGGCGWTNVLVTRVVLLLPRLLVAAGVVLLELVTVEAEVVPTAVTLVVS